MSTFLPLIQQQQKGGAEVVTLEPSQYASYLVEVGWDDTPVSGSAFLGTFDDLVAEEGHGVKSVRIRRGRDDNMSEMQAGVATIVLHDPDGLYNPQNAASSLAGKLLPLKPVRIRGNNGSEALGSVVDHPLFYGYIRSIEHDPRRGVQETVIECVDRLLGLDRLVPQAGLLGGGLGLAVGSIIGNIVSELDWAAPGFDSFATGDTLADEWYPTGSTATEEIRKLLEIERGVVYVAGNGTVVYEERGDRTAKTSSATIADTMSALRPGVDLDRIANRATVTRTGGEPQVADDAASQAIYGVIDAGAIESPYLADDAAALTIAQYLVDQLASPRSPMYGLDLMNRDVDTMNQILQRDLQDRVTVTDSLGGTSGDYIIEAIEHEITDGGKYHRCKWVLSARGAGAATGHTGAVGGVTKPDPPTVTIVPAGGSGPANQKDGDIVFYEADATNGVVWQFRWYAADSEWRFVGGPSLASEDAASGTRTSSAYGNLTGPSAGPTVTVPLTGDYRVKFGCFSQGSTATASQRAAVKRGGSATSDNDSIKQQPPGANFYSAGQTQRLITMTSVAASTALKMEYNTNAGTATFDSRWIEVTPISVTGI